MAHIELMVLHKIDVLKNFKLELMMLLYVWRTEALNHT